MNTKEKLNQALKDAMRSGNDLRKRTLRLALAAIKNAEIERKGDLEDERVLAILQKEVKARRETIEGAQQAGRTDMVEEAEAEIAILEEFLPQPLTRQELEALVQEAIAEVGATSPREMGNVMKVLMPKVQGRADGKEVSAMVRALLGG